MNIEVLMKDWYGWTHHTVGEYTLWFNGYVLNKSSHENLFESFLSLLSDPNTNQEILVEYCNSIRGHFSLVVYSEKKLFIMVDKVRSIPLFYKSGKNKITISNHSPMLIENIDNNKYNLIATVEVAMSGYTIGRKTMLDNICQLSAGEFLLFSGVKIEVTRYYRYSPWKAINRSKESFKKELTEVSKTILSDMVKSVEGRQIAILLSAGNDSRFIASGLKELNIQNVVCLSYGAKNSFEVKSANKIAQNLSYKWFHIPLSISVQKKSFSENLFSDYCNFSDSLSNSPIVMDYTAIKNIKDTNRVSSNAVFVNGNTGDFITGGHIFGYKPESDSSGIEEMIEKTIEKHYSLWECLKTEKNLSNIRKDLNKSFLEIMNSATLLDQDLWAVGESMEWSGRQSKFVTATQRSYEFFGYGWRLPMWDPMYMDFWENVPREYKINQNLYKEWLYENNWGGVWSSIKVNEFIISSRKVRVLRAFFKTLFFVLGKEKWSKFDKRAFWYFIDNTASTAIEPYFNVLFDHCGARNRNSWIVKKYLHSKAVDFQSLYE